MQAGRSPRGDLAPPRPGGWQAGRHLPLGSPPNGDRASPRRSGGDLHTFSPTVTHTLPTPRDTRTLPRSQPHTHSHTYPLCDTRDVLTSALHHTVSGCLCVCLCYAGTHHPYKPSASPGGCTLAPLPDVHSPWLTLWTASPQRWDSGSNSPLHAGLQATLPAWCLEILHDCCPGPAEDTAQIPTRGSDPGPSCCLTPLFPDSMHPSSHTICSLEDTLGTHRPLGSSPVFF